MKATNSIRTALTLLTTLTLALSVPALAANLHLTNGDLLGFKFDSWQGGHRVPFIARWPGKIRAGSVSDHLVCQLDLLATFAALTGSDASAPDSVNMLPVLTGTPSTSVRRELVITPQQKTHIAFRHDEWIYIGARGGGGFAGAKPGDHGPGGPAALKLSGEVNSDIVDGKFVPGAPEEQLDDLGSDPGQKKNVIGL